MITIYRKLVAFSSSNDHPLFCALSQDLCVLFGNYLTNKYFFTLVRRAVTYDGGLARSASRRSAAGYNRLTPNMNNDALLVT
jgi:hypothetical protein